MTSVEDRISSGRFDVVSEPVTDLAGAEREFWTG